MWRRGTSGTVGVGWYQEEDSAAATGGYMIRDKGNADS